MYSGILKVTFFWKFYYINSSPSDCKKICKGSLDSSQQAALNGGKVILIRSMDEELLLKVSKQLNVNNFSSVKPKDVRILPSICLIMMNQISHNSSYWDFWVR